MKTMALGNLLQHRSGLLRLSHDLRLFPCHLSALRSRELSA
jgi:hypothetical protein